MSEFIDERSLVVVQVGSQALKLSPASTEVLIPLT